MTLIPPTNTAGYVALPVSTDPNLLTQKALADIAAQLPGWVPREGHLEVAVIEEAAQMAAESAAVAAQMAPIIFEYLGQLLNITPLPGVEATAPVIFTMTGTAGYTIPAGTAVAYALTSGPGPTTSQVLFTVQTDIVIAPGASTGSGTIICETVGSFANALPAAAVLLVTSSSTVASVATTDVTSGGVDPETEAAYLNRLSSELQLLAPRPILAADFAAMAPNVEGVFRALAIDGLNPGRTVTDGVTNSTATVTSATANFVSGDVGRPISGTNIPASTYIGIVNSTTSIGLSSSATSNVPVNATGSGTGITLTIGDLTSQQRYVAVCGIDSSGNALSPTVQNNLQSYLNGKREVNFVVAMLSPTYTNIDVTVSCFAQHGFTTSSVQASIQAALQSFLNKATWGGGGQTPPTWLSTANVVRFLDIANVIKDTPGVLYIPSGSLTISIHGGSMGATDITLPGDAPLPVADTLSITVTAT